MLVILHGWMQDKASWEALASKFELLESTKMIELPSFGDEPMINQTWGVPEYAEWVKKKIEQHNWQNVILLGHSFGGRLSSLIAAERPNWLRGLILYGAPCLYRPKRSIRLKILLAKVFKHLLPASIKQRLQTEDVRSAEEQGLGKIFRRTIGFDQTHLLLKIHVPTLLIWGEQDQSVPLAMAKEINQLIPESQLEILPGLGHNAHLESPTLFYGKVKSFLEHLS